MKTLKMCALALLATMALASTLAQFAWADSPYGMSDLSGLVLTPLSGQTSSLVVKNTSGTAKFTVSAAGAVAMEGVMTLDSGEYITNATDDLVSIYGGSGTDDTDLTVDVDGTYPILYSITDSKIGIGDILAGQSGDSLSNAAADVWTFDCAGACVAAANLSIDTDEAGGVPALSSSTSTKIAIKEAIVGINGDSLSNDANDVWTFLCEGACTNAQSLYIDLDDATGPVIATLTGTAVQFGSSISATAGATVTCTGCLTGTNVADVTRTIPTQLHAWRYSFAGQPAAIVAGSIPNTNAEGSFETIEWSTGENIAGGTSIETSIIVPADYVSGMALKVWHMHEAAAANNAETLAVQWYTAAAGGADNPAVANEGAIAMTNAETVSTTSIPLDAAATIAAGQPLRVLLGFTAIDQDVHIAGLGFTYTSAQ
jgi:hypothetical protein